MTSVILTTPLEIARLSMGCMHVLMSAILTHMLCMLYITFGFMIVQTYCCKLVIINTFMYVLCQLYTSIYVNIILLCGYSTFVIVIISYLIRYDRYAMLWYGMVWYGMVCHRNDQRLNWLVLGYLILSFVNIDHILLLPSLPYHLHNLYACRML